jgi:pimeloyl-ACP methyl ester carboxylesterase
MRTMIYPAPPVPVGSPPAGFEEVWVEGESGRRSHAWFRQPDGLEPSRPAVLFFHGNGENLETLRLGDAIDRLGALSAAILVVDYPGYGRSEGSPSQEALTEAGVAAFDLLEELAPGRPRAVVGWSLGAAVALQVAERRADEVAAVGLLSPWSRLADVAGRHYPSLLVRLLLPESWDSIAAAKRYGGPTLVVHGGRDAIIPATQGRQVAGSLAQSQWLEIETAGHNDLLARERVWQALAELLEVAAGAEGSGYTLRPAKGVSNSEGET